jgi:hypothetical protein
MKIEGECRMFTNESAKKAILLKVIKFLETPLSLWDDPVYTDEEKKVIKDYEGLAFSFYCDLKADGHVSFKQTFFLSEKAKAERDKDIKFFKIAKDVSNKLVNTKEFDPQEQWFILLAQYCWFSELIKNLLLKEAKKLYRSWNGKDWKRSYMTLGEFLNEINTYKNGRFRVLFSVIDVDLRNSFDHANIDFNSHIRYHDKNGNEKSLKHDQLISMFKKIAPLYTTLSAYGSRVFSEELMSMVERLDKT